MGRIEKGVIQALHNVVHFLHCAFSASMVAVVVVALRGLVDVL